MFLTGLYKKLFKNSFKNLSIIKQILIKKD